ncbi:site-specific DNA-methyltransferase [Ramlibacter sp.]|uniref:site-specific DNA-methyltransferase n=1 Tax=Ramlibacter sp. TaxID=1917967 RepID=UPI002FC62E5E
MPTLDWLNREESFRTASQTPTRVLRPHPAGHVFGDPAAAAGNLLIQGDNLQALKALLPFYRGSVKCIFIDPPYNTKSAFEHYDDNLEHSEWLSMMLPRLQLLREFLREDGSIWVTIDDSEAHYLKVAMDEVFGRSNFVANIVWQKKSSPQSNSTWLSDSHDHVLCFAKNKAVFKPNLLPRSEKHNAIYKHSDEHDGIDAGGNWYGRGPWFPGDFTLSLASGQRGKQFAKTGESVNLYPITTPSGRVVWPAKGRAWAYTPESYQRLLAEHRVTFGKNGDNKPCIKRFVSEFGDKGVVPMTTWHYSEVGENRIAMQESKALFSEGAFATPKPEALLRRIVHVASDRNDRVLDSFLGSGTAVAVAHKMGRRWIGIEMGEHATTHCLPRLKKVIEGEQGGISAAVDWKGGGGFQMLQLGSPLFNAEGDIHPDVRFADLAAFIWMRETGAALALDAGASAQGRMPLLGVHEGTAYYLLFNGILGDRRPGSGNVLNSAVLQALRELCWREGPKVVYGEACRLGDARLQAEGIAFRQLPHAVPKS